MINIFYRKTQKRSALKFFCCYGDSPVLSCFIIKSHAIFAGCVGLHACSQKWTSLENKQWLVLADSYKNNYNCMFVCLHECLRESCPSKASTRRHLLLIFASLDQRFMFCFFFNYTHQVFPCLQGWTCLLSFFASFYFVSHSSTWCRQLKLTCSASVSYLPSLLLTMDNFQWGWMEIALQRRVGQNATCDVKDSLQLITVTWVQFLQIPIHLT